MATVGARIVVVALALAVLWPAPPAGAFRLYIGPFHMGLPSFGRYSRHHHRRVGPQAEPAPSASASNGAPDDLLYPILAWPALTDAIFRPQADRAWPFSYDSIFAQAFAKDYPKDYPHDRRGLAADRCPRENNAAGIIMRIRGEIAPTAAQRPLLEKLAAAIGQAGGYLLKSCPSEIPPRPVDRLRLMEPQVDALIMALEIVRPPLQRLEQSLDAGQRARFLARANTTRPARKSAASACATKPAPANWPLPVLEQIVPSTGAQGQALADLQHAFSRAVTDFDIDCSLGTARMPSARLQAIEARLDVTWQAVQTIEVALTQFQNHLTRQQSVRFDQLEIAAAP